MNFLAHLSLSGSDPEIMTGNFVGDFVRGRNLTSQFSEGVAKGIELHREIDAFTDSHPIVSQSKKRLWPIYRHYASVIVDVYYDHFLARNFSSYHAQSLPDFAQYCYQVLQLQHHALPTQVQRMLPFMIEGNWLVNYGSLEGMQLALSGLARRAQYDSKMEKSIHDLKTNYTEFEEEFRLFFPELKLMSDEYIKAK